MNLLSLGILILVLVVCIILLNKYVTPQIPAPWGGVVLAVCVVIAILILLGAIGIGPGIRL